MSINAERPLLTFRSFSIVQERFERFFIHRIARWPTDGWLAGWLDSCLRGHIPPHEFDISLFDIYMHYYIIAGLAAVGRLASQKLMLVYQEDERVPCPHTHIHLLLAMGTDFTLHVSQQNDRARRRATMQQQQWGENRSLTFSISATNWERSNLHKCMLDGTSAKCKCAEERYSSIWMTKREAVSGLFAFMESRASRFVISWLVNVASVRASRGVEGLEK